MDAIVVLLGLVIGIVIFMRLGKGDFLQSEICALYIYHLLGVSESYCMDAWKLAIIVGIIALIAYTYKMFGSSDEKDEEEGSEAGGEEKRALASLNLQSLV